MKRRKKRTRHNFTNAYANFTQSASELLIFQWNNINCFSFPISSTPQPRATYTEAICWPTPWEPGCSHPPTPAPRAPRPPSPSTTSCPSSSTPTPGTGFTKWNRTLGEVKFFCSLPQSWCVFELPSSNMHARTKTHLKVYPDCIQVLLKQTRFSHLVTRVIFGDVTGPSSPPPFATSFS